MADRPRTKDGGRPPRRADAPSAETGRVGKRGAIVIPAALRRRYGIEEGSMIIAEAHAGGVLIRPARVVAIETEAYSAARQAEFLLSNATGAADYAAAVAEVRALGLDPEAIPHHKPPGA